MHKKGSLEISINAIVILILAITILGLGLGFIRGQFGSLQEQFTKVSSNIENQIIEDIEKSGDLLVFTRLTFDNIKAGTKNEFYYGVKSTEAQRDTCFYVEFVCENAIGATCPQDSKMNELSATGVTAQIPSGWTWFNTLQGSKQAPGGVKVLKGLLQASNAAAATYNGRVIVWKHYIAASENAANAEYTSCLEGQIIQWPDSIKSVTASGTTTYPVITAKTADGSTVSRNVQHHASKEFFIELV